MLDVILSLVYVCTYGRNIAPAGDNCDRCDTDTGACTEGCMIVPEGDYCDICDICDTDMRCMYKRL